MSDTPLPKLPNLGIKKAMKAIINFFKSIPLPKFDIDIKQYIPNLPKMPDLGMSVEMPDGPKEPEELEVCMYPHEYKDAPKGTSPHFCREVAWCIYGAASHYRYRDGWYPSPYEQSTLMQWTLLSSKAYNAAKAPGKPSKPRGEGDVVPDDVL